MISIKKHTKSQDKQRKKGHSGHSAEDGGKRVCSAGRGMVGRILLQCCWNIMRSSQVLGSEGGEEGPGERGCAGGVHTSHWTARCAHTQEQAGRGGGRWAPGERRPRSCSRCLGCARRPSRGARVDERPSGSLPVEALSKLGSECF